MKNFSRIEADVLSVDPRQVINHFYQPSFTDDKRYFTVLKDEDCFLFGEWGVRAVEIPRMSNPYGLIELVIPAGGLNWFIDVIENKFGKPEAEGGLKADDYAYEEIIEGERLLVARMFGIPGYAFRNYSRQSYIFSTEHPQEMGLSDELLFTGGGLQALKDLAEKIALGQV